MIKDKLLCETKKIMNISVLIDGNNCAGRGFYENCKTADGKGQYTLLLPYGILDIWYL